MGSNPIMHVVNIYIFFFRSIVYFNTKECGVIGSIVDLGSIGVGSSPAILIVYNVFTP